MDRSYNYNYRQHRHRRLRQVPRQHDHSSFKYVSSEINCCVKYSIFGSNVFFFLVGFALLGVGVWARYEKNSAYYTFNRISKLYLDPSIFLMVIGGLIFIIGFSGCVGALRENTCFLALYSTIIGLLLLGEIAVAALILMSKDWLAQEFYGRLDETIVMYRDDPDLQAVMDWIQMYFKCCGMRSPHDWEKNIYFNKSSSSILSPEAGGVPYSCCIEPRTLENGPINLNCGHGTRSGEMLSDKIFHDGCSPKVEAYLLQNFTYIAFAIFGIGIVQILGILFAQSLRSDIFAQRARWFRR
uniref:Tetraspanin n=1 Tax=Syphacia muris TaxID=451379 RepID=A0A0N5AUK0_9BILA